MRMTASVNFPIAKTYEDDVDTPVVTTMLVMAMTMMRAVAR